MIINTPSGHRYTVLPDATVLLIDHADGRPIGSVFLPARGPGVRSLSVEAVLALIDSDPYGLTTVAATAP